MKSPNINLKDILAKLSVLKSNMGLLVPIAIAIVGLLLIIPTRILSARLRGTVEKNSVAVGNEIKQITSRLDEAKPVSEKQLNAMAQDANQIERLMEQANKRELLSYALFPDTNDQSRELFAQFGERYRTGVAALVQSLKPGEAATTAEVVTALTSAQRASDATGAGVGMLTMGQGGGAPLTLDSLTPSQIQIIDQLCLGKAWGAGIYASLGDVAGYSEWSRWTFQDRDRAYQDCWYWQLGYWIIEDVIATIQQMNGSAENVVAAPVKRLMGISFTFRRASLYNARPGGANAAGALGMGESERPVYVTGPTKGLTPTPCTARICNATADVVHFKVEVVVDAAQVMPFMQTLCSAKEHRYRGEKGREPEQKFEHNQITILEATIEPVEPTDVAHRFYRYGDRPAQRVELICEYLLNRTPAYESIKPPQAKKDLGESTDGQAPAQ